MDFINSTGIIYDVVSRMTTNITGAEALTWLSIFLLLIGVMSIGRIPLNFQFLFLTPLVLVLMAYNTTAFGLLGGLWLFVDAAILTKVIFFS